MVFHPDERSALLRVPRLGPRVVARLEAAGIDTLDCLARLGVERVIGIMGRGIRGSGWSNRRRALEQAVAEWQRNRAGTP